MAPTDYTTAGNEPPPGSYTYSTTSWCTSNADNTVWLSNDGWASSSWAAAAPVLKLRLGKWQPAEVRWELDAKDSKVAVQCQSRQLAAKADRLTRRALDRKPKAVVMHQPAWSARRWKSLT